MNYKVTSVLKEYIDLNPLDKRAFISELTDYILNSPIPGHGPAVTIRHPGLDLFHPEVNFEDTIPVQTLKITSF